MVKRTQFVARFSNYLMPLKGVTDSTHPKSPSASGWFSATGVQPVNEQYVLDLLFNMYSEKELPLDVFLDRIGELSPKQLQKTEQGIDFLLDRKHYIASAELTLLVLKMALVYVRTSSVIVLKDIYAQAVDVKTNYDAGGRCNSYLVAFGKLLTKSGEVAHSQPSVDSVFVARYSIKKIKMDPFILFSIIYGPRVRGFKSFIKEIQRYSRKQIKGVRQNLEYILEHSESGPRRLFALHMMHACVQYSLAKNFKHLRAEVGEARKAVRYAWKLDIRSISFAEFVERNNNLTKVPGRRAILVRGIIRALKRFIPTLNFSPFYWVLVDERVKKLIIWSGSHRVLVNLSMSVHEKILINLENEAIRTYNRAQIMSLGKSFREQGRYQNAFNLYFHKFKRDHHMGTGLKAIVCERELKNKELLEYFRAHGETMKPEVFHTLTCAYAVYLEEFEPDWNEILRLLNSKMVIPMANYAILAALGYKRTDVIDQLQDVIILYVNMGGRGHKLQDLRMDRSITMLAAAHYRSGRKDRLAQLDSQFSFNNKSWEIYMEFGRGGILKALNYRGEVIRDTFLIFYPHPNGRKGEKRIIVPEKDICGEAFNALFYQLILEDTGPFSVACDARMYNILSANFEGINFIPKTPRYKQRTEPSKFWGLSQGLGTFLDRASYEKVKGGEFITIDYNRYYHYESCARYLSSGWLTPDPKRVELWKAWLSDCKGNYFIGIASNSTVRSRIRDIHMVELDCWDHIFALEGCVFVNLNASLSAEDCANLSERYGVTVVNPPFDLHNDFDNLLALMSILDYGILPANNLMDFASSVGLRTLVFSPSNIMRVWAVGSDNHYIFSKNVRFVFPREGSMDNREIVADGAQMIRDDLGV